MLFNSLALTPSKLTLVVYLLHNQCLNFLENWNSVNSEGKWQLSTNYKQQAHSNLPIKESDLDHYIYSIVERA